MRITLSQENIAEGVKLYLQAQGIALNGEPTLSFDSSRRGGVKRINVVVDTDGNEIEDGKAAAKGTRQPRKPKADAGQDPVAGNTASNVGKTAPATPREAVEDGQVIEPTQPTKAEETAVAQAQGEKEPEQAQQAKPAAEGSLFG